MSDRFASLYCGPYGGSHTYRPMFIPAGVGLRRPPIKIPPFTNATRAIPVMRTEDHYPIHFYYFAEGCSDLYIHATESTGLVVRDRVDAIRRLLPANLASKMLGEYCGHEMERAAMHLMPKAFLATNGAMDMRAARSIVTQTGCFNSLLFQTMHSKGMQVLVLNYESPGGDTSGSEITKKIEIIYTGDRYYDAAGRPCRLTPINGCHACEKSRVSAATCSGKLAQLAKSTRPSYRPHEIKGHNIRQNRTLSRQVYFNDTLHAPDPVLVGTLR